MEEAKQQVIEWLEHPNELGCRPHKIECTNEFTDEDGIHCMIFKYKKTVLSPWLLAIAGDSGVFSEMQKYNEKTEVEDAKALLAFLKQYWKNKANEAEEREKRAGEASHFQAFVLMKQTEWKKDWFEKEFFREWGIQLEDAEEKDSVQQDSDQEGSVQKDSDRDGFVQKDVGQEDFAQEGVSQEDKEQDVGFYVVDQMHLVLGFMGFPIPDGEAEYHAQFNYLWKDAVDVTGTHKAHLLVTIMGEGTPVEKGLLYAKALTTLCRSEDVLGVYANGVVYEPKFFVAMSEIIENGDLPVFDWVWIGVGRDEEGVSVYTNGLTCFGKEELEIVNSKQPPSELRDFMMNIVGYLIEEDVIFHDGETVGYTNEQRLKLVKSEGVNVEGESLKILI